MEAAQAISLVQDWIRTRNLDYPTDGLEADRFDTGWSVYAPVDVDESDPMAFLDLPVGRSIFLVGDSGHIEEVSSSIPPQQARDQFTASELAELFPPGDEFDFMVDWIRASGETTADGPMAVADFNVVDWDMTDGNDAAIAQSRDAREAAGAVSADRAAGRTATPIVGIPPLPDLVARWAAISAAYTGTGSDPGPRMHPGYASYESDAGSGSTLFLLPGDRAVLSGGSWNSTPLDAAYNSSATLPDLYAGAPAWVNDSVLNSRIRSGLLTFCFWWVDGRWFRGASNTLGELEGACPPFWTADTTVDAMAAEIDSRVRDQCRTLLTAATAHAAAREDVAAAFAYDPIAEVDAAVNQLSLAGLLGRDHY